MTNQQDVPEQPGDVQFEGVVPILRVSDFERSIDYHVDVLGFSLEWRDGRFGSVRRGGASLMLSEGSQGCSSTWLWGLRGGSAGGVAPGVDHATRCSPGRVGRAADRHGCSGG